MAQTLTHAGYKVTLFVDILETSQKHLEWVNIQRLPDDIESLLDSFDLYLLDILAPWVQKYLQQILNTSSNKLFFTAKDFPPGFVTCSVPKSVATLNLIHRPFCLNSGNGKCMIEWVDDYAKNVFGLSAISERPTVRFYNFSKNERNVVIFPTTPNEKKNFSQKKFYKLAKTLSKSGMKVEIVGMPHEEEKLERSFEGFKINTFQEVNGLIEYLKAAIVVVSNDSGGGHLAAMLGIPTVTITRKEKSFVWRPGYNLGNVVSPGFTFKLGRGHIWQPFISIKKIEKLIMRINSSNY